MNIQVKPNTKVSSLMEDQKIEHTIFSVVKPTPKTGYTTIFENSTGEIIPYDLKTLTKGDIKKQKLQTVYFVMNDKINAEFSFSLYSKLMELLMETKLKCQIEITDTNFIVKNKVIDIMEDFAQAIQEQLTTMVLSKSDESIHTINNVIQELPMRLKDVFNEYAKIINARLSDTYITDKAKKDTIKGEIYKALENNDLYEMVDNKELTMEILKMREEIVDSQNRLKEKNIVDSTRIENESYSLLLERFKQLKDSNMIPADMSAEAFIEKLKTKDAVFANISNHKEESIEEKKGVKDEEKAYFEE